MTFFVDDLKETADVLNQEGAPVFWSGSIDWSKLVVSEKLNSESLVYLIDTMEKLGFHLELSGKLPEEVLDLFRVNDTT